MNCSWTVLCYEMEKSGSDAVNVLVEVPEEVSCVLERGGSHRFVVCGTGSRALRVAGGYAY